MRANRLYKVFVYSLVNGVKEMEKRFSPEELREWG